MNVPAAVDIIQEVNGSLEVPEIRVWIHPHRIGKDGDDYYFVFKSFEAALKFISSHPEAEETPLVAFRGYEMDLFAIKRREKKVGK
jgi:hypothetical protein